MVDHFCATYGFLEHFDTKIIYIPVYIYTCIYIWCISHICIYIYLYIYTCIYIWCICQNLCSVKHKFQCPISQLTKTIFTWNFEGDLIDHQPCFIPNFKFLAVQELNFREPKFGQDRLLTGFCMYIGPAIIFVLYLDLTSGLCRAVFPMYLVSPIGLPAY